MKRTVCVALCTALFATMLASCGLNKTSVIPGASSSEDLLSVHEFSALDYVTLGEYKDLKVTLDGDYSTDEAALNEYVDQLIQSAGAYTKDEEATEVDVDSIVNVNYVGKKDGEAFAGGSSDNVFIDVAANCEATSGNGYIDGFTDGLVGAKVGEDVDCNVKFPDDYGNADLAGADAVFTFTINYIAKPIDRENLTDDYVSENFGFDTVDEFMETAKQALIEKQEEAKEKDKRIAVVDTVMNNCTVNSYPEDEYQARIQEYRDSFMEAYEVEDLESFLTDNYDGTVEEFDKEIEDQIKSNLDQELVFLAIAEKEGIEVDEAGYAQYAANMVANYGEDNETTLYESFAANAERGEAYLRRIYQCNMAIDLCVDSATVE